MTINPDTLLTFTVIIITITIIGMWKCHVTTGDGPPPCSALTFTAIDDRRAVAFGGQNRKIKKMNTVYIIDLITMVM